MLLQLSTIFLFCPLFSSGAKSFYNSNQYTYGNTYGYGGYQQQQYVGYAGQSPYYQFGYHNYAPKWSGISHGFRNYIYPVYEYLPNVGSLLKKGAYGALKGAGVGAAVGGIVGLIG